MNIEQVKKVMEDIKDQELEIIETMRGLEYKLRQEKEKLEKAKDVLRALVAYKDNLKKK